MRYYKNNKTGNGISPTYVCIQLLEEGVMQRCYRALLSLLPRPQLPDIHTFTVLLLACTVRK